MIKLLITIGGVAVASLLLAIVGEVWSTIKGRECNRRNRERLDTGILSPSDYRALKQRGGLNDLIRKGF